MNKRILNRLRKLCLEFPDATEQEAWGDPTWRVSKKIFAMQKGNYEGGRPSVWMKAADGAQAMLVESNEDRFFVPPYVGHKGWIGIYLDDDIDWDELHYLVEQSYRLIAPKKLVAKLVGSDESPSDDQLESLRNIGARTAQWLRDVDVSTTEALAQIGPVEAYRRLKSTWPDRVSLNALWALAGALADVPWNKVPSDVKDRLLAELGETRGGERRRR